MPGIRASVKNEKQYEGLKKKGVSKELAGRLQPRREELWEEEGLKGTDRPDLRRLVDLARRGVDT